MLFFSRNHPWNQIFAPPPHFMVSEISFGLNQCRITFGTALECIELACLLITARNQHLPKYRQKLVTALATPKIVRMTWDFQNKFGLTRRFEWRCRFFISLPKQSTRWRCKNTRSEKYLPWDATDNSNKLMRWKYT